MYVILVYDIQLKEEEPEEQAVVTVAEGQEEEEPIKGRGQRILRRVFKVCKQYLGHIQNSVFEGSLTESQFMQMKYELKEIIREDKDSIICFTSSSDEWLNKEVMGINKNDLSNIL